MAVRCTDNAGITFEIRFRRWTSVLFILTSLVARTSNAAVSAVWCFAGTVIVHLIARADTGAVDTAFAPAAGHTGAGIGNNTLIIGVTFLAAAAVTVCHTLYALSGRFVAYPGRTAAGYSPVFTG